MVAMLAGTASPVLLISDLGRPGAVPQHAARVQAHLADERGLVAARRSRATSNGLAAAWKVLGLISRERASRRALAAGITGPPMTTYTAALLANTAIPVWREARSELPFVFAGGAAASAGAAVAALTPVAEAGPARRLTVLGRRGRGGRGR